MDLSTYSEAFPNPHAPTIVSASHLWAHNHLDLLQDNLRYTVRPLNPHELQECKALHKEWFPIDYSDQFYRLIPTSVHVLAAVIDLSYYDVPSPDTVIVGLLLYRLQSADSNYLRVTHWFTSSPAVYILTLGVISPLRKHGIAQRLLQELQSTCADLSPRPVYIYLHVAAYNASAIRFYQTAGFTLHEELRDHYLIDGRRYSAYVYVLYVFGSKPPLLTFQNLQWLFCSVAR